MAKNLFLHTFIIASAVVLSPAQAQTFLTNELVAYYPFDGNANDASGHGNNGTVQGATLTANQFGNRAYAFDGIQNRILIPETIFGATNPAITISAWVTTDNGPYSGNQNIFEKSSRNGEMDMFIFANQFKFGPVLSNPYGGIYLNTPLTSNSLTHVVGVYQQGQGVWLYINGTLANSVTGIPNSPLWVDKSGYPLNSATAYIIIRRDPITPFGECLTTLEFIRGPSRLPRFNSFINPNLPHQLRSQISVCTQA